MQSVELIGWASSAVLFVTILSQIRTQWRARQTKGVSPLLFIGQLAANIGFLVYSILVDNVVFAVTNVVLASTALLGLVVLLVHRRREKRGPVRAVDAYAFPT